MLHVWRDVADHVVQQNKYLKFITYQVKNNISDNDFNIR